MDNQPVIAIVGQQGLNSFGTFAQQENNLERVFADVAVYVQTIVSPEQAPAVVDTAFRSARVRLQPAVIIIPHDVQAMEMVLPEARDVGYTVQRGRPLHGDHPTRTAKSPRPPTSSTRDRRSHSSSDTERTGQLTKSSKRLAERVPASLLLCAASRSCPRRSRITLNNWVCSGRYRVWSRCATATRSSCSAQTIPYSQFLPESGQARALQIDLKPEQLGLRYPTELNLWGDVKATLTALIPLLETKSDHSWQDGVAEGMRKWEAEMEAQAMLSYPDGVNPRRVFHELNKRLPPEAIVTADAGTTADWYGHHIRLRRGMMGDLSGRLATMLAAMPYAEAAKFAFSDRPVICTIGDGAFQMLGMNELITIKKYMDQWDNAQFVIVVLHNDDLAQVSWEMRTEDANPMWSTSQDVQSVDYAGWAELVGFTGIKVTSDDEIGQAFDRAFSTQGVTLIDAYTSKNVPPLPPHISRTFALNTMKALLKGDPAAREVVRDSTEALLSEGLQRAKSVLHLTEDKSAKD